ncbi:hypothetical protein [Actinopolymorpha sp. B9G3]|uniref:hypothetical protein n=1 Tax=Actinopolymorpha sp. B9G3 TaxID=3158970 RepID=UPI0032D8F1E3
MALKDLTDKQAVLAALAEFDAIGRQAFLSRYGFRLATGYFVLHEGRPYDSKAIAGVAHGYQHGTALRAKEFSGGAATVAARLTSLGFLVTVPSGPKWTLPIGAETTRSDVAAIYGGGKYGGIEPSRQSDNILVYTDPAAGARHGYNFDGWDASEPGVFYYTGEARRAISSSAAPATKQYCSSPGPRRRFGYSKPWTVVDGRAASSSGTSAPSASTRITRTGSRPHQMIRATREG